MMNATINSILLLANRAESQARKTNNTSLFGHAQRAKRFALALQSIENLAFDGPHSQVDIKLCCTQEDDLNVVDFEVVGYDEWGNPGDITSDLGTMSIVEAIEEIAADIEQE